MADTFKDGHGHRYGKHHARGCNHSGRKSCDWCERRLRIASLRLEQKARDELQQELRQYAVNGWLNIDGFLENEYTELGRFDFDDSVWDDYDYYRGYGYEDAL